MAKPSGLEARKNKQSVQVYFWNIVDAAEHINLPKLEDAVQKESNCRDDRFVQMQIMLMQTESRIRVQSKVKVQIK